MTAKHLPPPGRACTVGPTAVTGERCGKPAVAYFIAGGRVFAECAEHAAPGSVA